MFDTAVPLTAVDPRALDEERQVELIVAWATVVNAANAGLVRAVAAFAGPPPTSPDESAAFAWAELAPALGLGDGAARRLVDTARDLCDRLPATMRAMTDGWLSLTKAQMLAERTSTLTPDQCKAVEAHVLVNAAHRSPAKVDAETRRVIDRIDPDGLADRHRKAREDVRLIRDHYGNGMGQLFAEMSSVDLEIVWSAADTHARSRKSAGDARTLDHLRVDALVTWAEHHLAHGTGDVPAPTSHGRPVTIHLSVDAETVAGVVDHPAEILGTGALIPARAARELLPLSRTDVVAVDRSTGRLACAASGGRAYRPGREVATQVLLRDVNPVTPNGTVVTAHAGHDLDHIVPFPLGSTTVDNLQTLTRSWHRAKTLAGWTCVRNRSGTVTWTSPRGRSYDVAPHDYRLGPPP